MTKNKQNPHAMNYGGPLAVTQLDFQAKVVSFGIIIRRENRPRNKDRVLAIARMACGMIENGDWEAER